MWGSNDFGFSSKESEGRSGGMLMIWNSRKFKMQSESRGDHYLCVQGLWGQEEIPIAIVNVYAPCEAAKKRVLWEKLSDLLATRPGFRWCVLGDFNSIRMEVERKGVGDFMRREEMIEFDSFITDSELVDLPLIGRKFTWSRIDGSSMSRIDRFLLSEEWCMQWPNSSQWCLEKGLSDHCPILLQDEVKNWGPRPFRMLNCWSEMEG
ncbi:DUF4283 domain protein, partial [Trifolium medium]|nr:DUF4283 domain protein [Trifolium medium]